MIYNNQSMNIFKKLLFLVIILLQKKNITIETTTWLSFGILGIVEIYHIISETKQSHKINTDSDIMISINKNVNRYLFENHKTNILKNLHINKNIISEFSTWAPAIIVGTPSIIFNNNTSKKIISGGFWIIISEILTYLIKKNQRSENKDTINKKLKNLFYNNIDKNNSFRITNSQFFIEYMKLILSPCTQNTLLLDKLNPLYKKINEIDNIIKELNVYNFKNITFQATKDTDTLMQKISDKDPFNYILSSDFTKKIDEIYFLLKKYISLVDLINTNIVIPLKEILDEPYLNIVDINKKYNNFKKKIESIDFSDTSIENITKNYNDFCKEIENLKNKLKIINQKKYFFENTIIKPIEKILQNTSINTLSLQKEIDQYKEEISTITLDKIEDTLNKYTKKFNHDIEIFNNLINNPLSNTHRDLYNVIIDQHEFVKKKHIIEKTLKTDLESKKLTVTDSTIIIQEKISSLEKIKKSSFSIIDTLKNILTEEYTLTIKIKTYNEMISEKIFNNFPIIKDNYKKDYYTFDGDTLLLYQSDLKKKNCEIAFYEDLLSDLKLLLKKYTKNNKDIEKTFSAIQSLGIFIPYINNSEKYKKIENNYKTFLLKKIEFSPTHSNSNDYKNTIDNLNLIAQEQHKEITNLFLFYKKVEEYNNEFNIIIENLKNTLINSNIENDYNKGLDTFILNMNNFFSESLSKIIHSSNNQSNFDQIKNSITKIKNNFEFIITTNNTLDEIKSSIEKELECYKTCKFFNTNEKNTIKKHYDQITNLINNDFNNYLSDNHLTIYNNFNTNQYIDAINNLKAILINTKNNIEEIEKNLNFLNNQKKIIENEEDKYNSLLIKYNLILTKNYYIEAIEKIKYEKEILKKHRNNINQKIVELSTDHSSLSNTKKIIDLKNNYFNDNLRKKKIICHSIKENLQNKLTIIDDEKKAEKNSEIEIAETELKECETLSIDNISKISDNIDNILIKLLKN